MRRSWSGEGACSCVLLEACRETSVGTRTATTAATAPACSTRCWGGRARPRTPVTTRSGYRTTSCRRRRIARVDYPMIECYTTLGALATVASKVRLGAFVGCPAYRSAALLGKILTTLDVISGGRAVFGIGAGWYNRAHGLRVRSRTPRRGVRAPRGDYRDRAVDVRERDDDLPREALSGRGRAELPRPVQAAGCRS